MRDTLVFIGMPGSGKSTIARTFAQRVGYELIDVDRLIEERIGCTLQVFLNHLGEEKFRQIEEEILLTLEASKSKNAIIDTGGSAIYSDKGMAHLSTFAELIYLKVSFLTISQRIRNLRSRGIVGMQNGDLEGVYQQRLPLYEKYANCIIEADGLSKEGTLRLLEEKLCGGSN